MKKNLKMQKNEENVENDEKWRKKKKKERKLRNTKKWKKSEEWWKIKKKEKWWNIRKLNQNEEICGKTKKNVENDENWWKMKKKKENCGKNMLDDCLFPRHLMSAMVKTRDECQLTAYMSLDCNLSYDGQSYESVVPVKFLFVLLDMCDEHETYNALVVVWSGRRSTLRTAKRDTWHGTVWARTRETHWHFILTAVCIKPRKESSIKQFERNRAKKEKKKIFLQNFF